MGQMRLHIDGEGLPKDLQPIKLDNHDDYYNDVDDLSKGDDGDND